MLDQGRIPVDVYVTMRMQSDAIEPAATMSSPGMGDDGKPVAVDPPPAPDPGTLPCDTASTCMTPTPSPGADGGVGADPGTGGGGSDTGGVCTGSAAGMTDTLGEAVLFDFDSSTLKPSAGAQLDAWVHAIKSGGYSSVTINGYTDPLGSKSYNQTLSQKRADAVKDYLVSHGVDAGIVTAVGKGSTEKYATLGDCAAQPTLALEQSCLQPDRYVEMVAK
jgi:outer membrane protein OmpA-like peptidoglycan-associated protein